MAAGDGEAVFSFGKHSYVDEKMYQRYIGADYSSLDELDDDVFHPDDYIFPGQSGSLSPPSFFSQTQSYTCFLGRVHLFPLTHCCGPGNRSTEHEDKATQTQSPPSPSDDIMLPCGVTEEPQRLFYGNAGYRLHSSTSPDPNLHLQGVLRGRQDMSAEVQIARKLQRIGDQFHRLHVQRMTQKKQALKQPTTNLSSMLIHQVHIPLKVKNKQLLSMQYDESYITCDSPAHSSHDIANSDDNEL